MDRLKQFWLRLLGVGLCLCLLLPVPASAADLYFTAVNDRLLPLTADTMPLWSGGVLYVPYSVFDREVSQVELGMEVSYSQSSQMLTFYNTRLRMTFDLEEGTCEDNITGAIYSAKAIIRNGRPYVPLNTVCNFFGLERSYTAISQGYLVRIKNDKAVNTDAQFIEAAGELIELRLREYNQSLNPTPSPNTPPVTPSTPSDHDDTESSSDVRTYLAFLCQQPQGLTVILDALDARGAHAMFFFSPQALEEAGTLVQRILGTGHSIGLLAQEANLTDTLSLLEEGNRLLELTTHSRAAVAYAPKSQRAALEEAGWVCWSETLFLEPSESVGANTFASSALRRLNGRTGSVYLTMDANANSARVLASLLSQVNSNHFILSTPLETRI